MHWLLYKRINEHIKLCSVGCAGLGRQDPHRRRRSRRTPLLFLQARPLALVPFIRSERLCVMLCLADVLMNRHVQHTQLNKTCMPAAVCAVQHVMQVCIGSCVRLCCARQTCVCCPRCPAATDAQARARSQRRGGQGRPRAHVRQRLCHRAGGAGPAEREAGKAGQEGAACSVRTSSCLRLMR